MFIGILADLSPMFILVGRKENWRIMAAGEVGGKWKSMRVRQNNRVA